MMRREIRRLIARLIIALNRDAARAVALALVSSIAIAQPAAAQSMTLEQYRAAPTPEDGFALERPTEAGHLRASFGAHLTYALTPLAFVADTPPFDRVTLVEHQVSLQITAALGLAAPCTPVSTRWHVAGCR